MLDLKTQTNRYSGKTQVNVGLVSQLTGLGEVVVTVLWYTA
jgi:hypothetical protein